MLGGRWCSERVCDASCRVYVLVIISTDKSEKCAVCATREDERIAREAAPGCSVRPASTQLPAHVTLTRSTATAAGGSTALSTRPSTLACPVASTCPTCPASRLSPATSLAPPAGPEAPSRNFCDSETRKKQFVMPIYMHTRQFTARPIVGALHHTL